MSAISTATSSPSSSVAGQRSPALKALDDYQEVTLPSSFTYAWVMQNIDQMRQSNMQYDPANCPPETPSLYWDSQPSTAELPDPNVHSVFEDWDDDVIRAANLSAAVFVEEDGTQTLIIPADSPYFLPPTPKKPFGFGFSYAEPAEADMCFERESKYEVPSVPLTPPNTSNDPSQEDHDVNIFESRGLILHLNTSLYPTLGSGGALFSSALSPPAPWLSDDASWAPKGFMQGPDVPLDCIYSAGDVSPTTCHWGDEAWFPVVVAPFRSAPCF